MSSRDSFDPLPLEMRDSKLAASLNLIPIPFALGYAYLGSWGRFTISIFWRVGVVGVGVSAFIAQDLSCDPCLPSDQVNFAPAYALTLTAVGVSLAFSALGAYRLAERRNTSIVTSMRANKRLIDR